MEADVENGETCYRRSRRKRNLRKENGIQEKKTEPKNRKRNLEIFCVLHCKALLYPNRYIYIKCNYIEKDIDEKDTVDLRLGLGSCQILCKVKLFCSHTYGGEQHNLDKLFSYKTIK